MRARIAAAGVVELVQGWDVDGHGVLLPGQMAAGIAGLPVRQR